MSFFKRALVGIGADSAKVDMKLESGRVAVGRAAARRNAHSRRAIEAADRPQSVQALVR